MIALPPCADLFDAGIARAVVLDDDDIPRLQRFFECNPDYFRSVNGEMPAADEAYRELHSTLPDGWSFSWQRSIAFVDGRDDVVAVASVVADLLASGVWHIGLFIVATPLHGTGAARSLYEALERFAATSGARWLRLGVVVGNARAEHFWIRCGFIDVRLRAGVPMGARVNDVRVMVKPLTGEALADYRALVPRDDSNRDDG